MSKDEAAIEGMIQEAGKTAPRLTPADIDATIVREDYINAGEATGCEHLRVLTVCVITLRNGFTVTGESACASPQNYDEAIGRRIARDNARAKIWMLEGYLLKERMYRGHIG